MDIFYDALLDAFFDNWYMFPILLIIYFLVQYIESKFGNTINKKLKMWGQYWPILGSIFALLPQCWFSVIATALYNKRIITVGTLIAVYLATSDEAIPIILANPEKAYFVVPILIIKLITWILFWYIIDFLYFKSQKTILEHSQHTSPSDDCNVVIKNLSVDACCGHHCWKSTSKHIYWHPLWHTIKIWMILFVVSLILNVIIMNIWEQNLWNFLKIWWRFTYPIAWLFGLIPNCAVSLTIAQIFLSDWLSFGAMMTGLCAWWWLWYVLLFKENKIMKTVKILTIVLIISVLIGVLIDVFL